LAGKDRDYLRSFVQRRRADYHLTGLEVLDRQGAPLAASYDPQLRGAPELPRPAPGGPETPTEAVLHQKLGKQEVLSFLAPVAGAAGEVQGYVLVRQGIPETHLLRVAAAERSLQELRQRLLQFSPLKVSHYLGLIIVTLIAMMAAIWLGFYMARELTTPIRELAEGALKVAGGDYDFQIHQEGRDEIGFLVQSFNKMTQDLQQGKAQLAAAYGQLRVSHDLISSQKRDMEILLKNVAAGVIALDAAGKVTMINDSAAQMLRRKREEVLGREAQVLLPPAEYHRMVEVVAAARAAARGTVEKPLHLILPNQTLYLLLKTTVLKDEAGRDLGVVIVFEDLTDLERAQRLAAWREVARRIAHEVKNPLTPLKLAAQRLQRRYADRLGEDGRVFQECTQIIVNQVEELQSLVNNFARFARLPQLTLAPQDFNALVQETLLLYREFQPRVSLEFHPDPQLPPVLLDREQVKRLLLNLLDNALASIDGAGTIAVFLRRTPADGRVELSVADTGRGVPDRDKVRIFEPYFSTKRGGTGLGLAIVNSIVAEHQGHIRVEDNVPQGTKFIIDFPMRRADYAGNLAGS
jgi:two-component system nitrogen regulation sensor histidine kinase NtrY